MSVLRVGIGDRRRVRRCRRCADRAGLPRSPGTSACVASSISSSDSGKVTPKGRTASTMAATASPYRPASW